MTVLDPGSATNCVAQPIFTDACSGSVSLEVRIAARATNVYDRYNEDDLDDMFRQEGVTSLRASDSEGYHSVVSA